MHNASPMIAMMNRRTAQAFRHTLSTAPNSRPLSHPLKKSNVNQLGNVLAQSTHLLLDSLEFMVSFGCILYIKGRKYFIGSKRTAPPKFYFVFINIRQLLKKQKHSEQS